MKKVASRYTTLFINYTILFVSYTTLLGLQGCNPKNRENAFRISHQLTIIITLILGGSSRHSDAARSRRPRTDLEENLKEDLEEEDLEEALEEVMEEVMVKIMEEDVDEDTIILRPRPTIAPG